MRSFLWWTFALVSAVTASNGIELEDGFTKVTCGSTIKLTNLDNRHKLHSHGVSYGSGSGQQSVTGFPEADNAKSFWIVEASFGRACDRGDPIPCGAKIRLRHADTLAYLHSHEHLSPLSGQQEVSCYDGQDGGDDWAILCDDSSSGYWLREDPVQLRHVDTKTFLWSDAMHQYSHPIPGHLEVAGVKSPSKKSQWIAEEGIYFAETTSSSP